MKQDDDNKAVSGIAMPDDDVEIQDAGKASQDPGGCVPDIDATTGDFGGKIQHPGIAVQENGAAI